MTEFIWVEKYRPSTVEDCILPDSLKNMFKEFVKQGEVITLLLAGPPGCGKTTIAKAMLNEMDADYILINGSKDGNIDNLRTLIQGFASTVSFKGGRKYVILDEADGLTPAIQNALRGFIEECSANCGFILTCNHKNKIIDAIVDSRCSVIDFNFKKKELPNLASQFLKRSMVILDKENVEYDRKVLATVIAKNCPDWRRTLNELQKWAATYGKITEDILVNFSDTHFNDLIKALKVKDFGTARKWIGEHSDIDMDHMFKKIYDGAYDLVEGHSIPDLILILAKYQYQNAFVANPEINLAAAILEIMGTCTFK